MITKITIENFKGIGEKVELDVAPMTLLFGANSAGKSTVLEALQYLREVLTERYFGSVIGNQSSATDFRTVVHNRDLNKTIRLGLHFEYSDEDAFTIDGCDEQYCDVNSLGLRCDLEWSNVLGKAVVTSLASYVNGELIGALASPLGHRNQFLGLNLSNSALSEVDSDEAITMHQAYGFDLPATVFLHDVFYDDCADDVSRDLFDDLFGTGFEISAFPKNALAAIAVNLRALGIISNETICEKEFGSGRIHFASFAAQTGADAVPRLRGNWISEFGDPDLDNFRAGLDAHNEQPPDPEAYVHDLRFAKRCTLALRQVASQVIETVISETLVVLGNSRNLGPLRVVPDATSFVTPLPGNGGWKDGLVAWQRLAGSGNSVLFEKINHWLSTRLKTGYDLRLQQMVDVSAMDYSRITNPDSGELPGEVLNDKRRVKQYPTLAIVPTQKAKSRKYANYSLGLEFENVGVGISQVIPVLVAALDADSSLVAVEQPELHLHPGMQTELGDLFIEAGKAENANQFVIETHSEHLILRILRRIRETADDELDDSATDLTVQPQDLAVYYFEATEKGTTVKRLRVNEEGEFMDRWPHGFFDERLDELY